MIEFLPAEQRFLGLDDSMANPETAGAVVVCVPFEQTSSYGLGSSLGPAAILRASHEVELRDAELGIEPWRVAGGIATRVPLAVTDADDGPSIAGALDDAVAPFIERGQLVATLGGEHTSIVGAVRAHARAFPGLTVLQIDAHSDLRGSYNGEPWNHACAMSRVLECAPDLVQVGIRSEATEDLPLRDKHAVRTLYANRLHDDDHSGADWIAGVIGSCAQNVYVTLDCDALDPSILPATGTPEPGGITWRQINTLLERVCAERRVVGFDINELAPIEGLSHPQFMMAKLAARFIAWAAHSNRTNR